jgi:4-hydroxy-tetrahydrodipicolinate synthase
MEMTGILPALITPFDRHGEVDHETLAELVEHQLKAGVRGFVPLGTTGEHYALSDAERRAVLKTVRDIVGDRGTLIAGANGASTFEVMGQIRQARDVGYVNFLIAPPYYSMPTQEELVGHYRAILDEIPDINIVLYNYPVRTNVEISHHVLDAFKENPRVTGIKESSGNLRRAIEIDTRYGDGYQLSCGSDDQALDFFLWGASSWICGPANCLAAQTVSIYERFIAGDIRGAQDVMRTLFPVLSSMESGKFIQKVKYGCELAGFDVGVPRLPLQPLSAQEKADFRSAFERCII